MSGSREFGNDRRTRQLQFLWQTACCRRSLRSSVGGLCEPLGVLTLSAVVAVICGVYVAPQGFVLAAAIGAVIAVGCLWPWIGVQGVSAELGFSVPRTREGVAVDAELTITNRWPWPVWGLCVEGALLNATDEGETVETAVSRVDGWSRSTFRWEVTPGLRGCYPSMRPLITSSFPFGLWKGKRKIAVLSQLIVWPKTIALSPLMSVERSATLAGEPNDNLCGMVGERTGVREYRHGDSLKQVNWSKSARFDRLISFERQGTATLDAVVKIDTDPTLHVGAGRHASVEWVIRIAASICDTLLRQNMCVLLRTGGDDFHARPRRQDHVAMLDWLARLNPHSTLPDAPMKPAKGPTKDAITIRVTTDRAQADTGQSIIFLTNLPDDRDSMSQRAHTSGWIVIDSRRDIPEQLRRGWRTVPRKLRYVS